MNALVAPYVDPTPDPRPARIALWETVRDLAVGLNAGNTIRHTVRHGATVSGRATQLEAHAGAPGLPL